MKNPIKSLKHLDMKVLLLGNAERKGLLKAGTLYIILIFVGFVYLYPFLYMLVNSFMSTEDLLDPKITWLPGSPTLENYAEAIDLLRYFRRFLNSVITSVIPAIFQTVSCAVIAFGLSKFKMKLKPLWLALIVISFIIPTHVLTVPRYMIYDTYNMIDTVLPAFVPALLGQGLKSSIFILVFFQGFNTMPKSLEEAADIDGCGKYRFFTAIAIPNAKSPIVLTFLFSLVWYWNELQQFNLFFGSKIVTLTMSLSRLSETYFWTYGNSDAGNQFTSGINMAGTALSILPIILLFVCLQRQFVTSIENSGITGE